MSSNIPAGLDASDSLDSERHGSPVHTGGREPGGQRSADSASARSRARARKPEEQCLEHHPTLVRVLLYIGCCRVMCVCAAAVPHLPLARVAAYGPLGDWVHRIASGSAPVEILRTVPPPLTEVQTDPWQFLFGERSFISHSTSKY